MAGIENKTNKKFQLSDFFPKYGLLGALWGGLFSIGSSGTGAEIQKFWFHKMYNFCISQAILAVRKTVFQEIRSAEKLLPPF